MSLIPHDSQVSVSLWRTSVTGKMESSHRVNLSKKTPSMNVVTITSCLARVRWYLLFRRLNHLRRLRFLHLCDLGIVSLLLLLRLFVFLLLLLLLLLLRL